MEMCITSTGTVIVIDFFFSEVLNWTIKWQAVFSILIPCQITPKDQLEGAPFAHFSYLCNVGSFLHQSSEFQVAVR